MLNYYVLVNDFETAAFEHLSDAQWFAGFFEGAQVYNKAAQGFVKA